MHTVLLSGSPILDVDASLFIYIGMFGLLFLLLRAWVFKPTMVLFDAREAAIGGAKEEARQLSESAEEKLTSFEQEMARVRTEASAERDRLRGEGTRLERTLVEKVRKETEEMVKEAETKMAAEATKLRAEMATNSPKLAMQITEKLLGREVRA